MDDEIPLSSIFLIVNEVMEVTPVIEAELFTEDVTTEPVIVSLTSVTGVGAISKDVSKDASISDKFGRKDSPNAVCKLMIIRFRLGFFIHSTASAFRCRQVMAVIHPDRAHEARRLPWPASTGRPPFFKDYLHTSEVCR